MRELPPTKQRRSKTEPAKQAREKDLKAELWRLRQIEVRYFALQMAIVEHTELLSRIDSMQPGDMTELDNMIQEYINERVRKYAH